MKVTTYEEIRAWVEKRILSGTVITFFDNANPSATTAHARVCRVVFMGQGAHSGVEVKLTTAGRDDNEALWKAAARMKKEYEIT